MVRSAVFQCLSSCVVTVSAGHAFETLSSVSYGSVLVSVKRRSHAFYCFVMNDLTLSTHSWLSLKVNLLMLK